MKLLLLTTFVTIICYVNAGKTARLLAALSAAGVANRANPGLMVGGLNPPMVAGGGAGLIVGGLNPPMVAGGGAGLMVGGLNPPMVAGGGAGLIGQPQFVQVVPEVPVYSVQAPLPRVYSVPGVTTFQQPFIGVPQMAPINQPQQPVGGMPVGAMQQQAPLQVDPLRRFRRQVMKQDNLKATVDTQIPAPTDTTTTTVCDEKGHHEDN